MCGTYAALRPISRTEAGVAREGMAYTRRFNQTMLEQLCAISLASVALARCEFDELDRLVDEYRTSPGYHVRLIGAMRESLRGNAASARELLPSPEEAGGIPNELRHCACLQGARVPRNRRTGECPGGSFAGLCDALARPARQCCHNNGVAIAYGRQSSSGRCGARARRRQVPACDARTGDPSARGMLA